MHESVMKIALIGPESSGKTTLCEHLAKYFNTVWVPELARQYIGSLHRKYTLGDIEYCSQMQINEEDRLEKEANRVMFCDSEMIIAKVWCEDVFKTVPAWLEEAASQRHYDLFLLTRPDLPFVPDVVRENPHRREFFFDWYRRELDNRNFTYAVIEGTEEDRFRNALGAIREHFPDL